MLKLPLKLGNENQPTEDVAGVSSPGANDHLAGITVNASFRRFNACNAVFARAQWDPRIRTQKAIDYFKSMVGYPPKIRKTDGYGQKDFAIRNASWVLANLTVDRRFHEHRHDGFLDTITEYRPKYETVLEVESPAEMAREIKKVGKLFGADLVGITALDKRWHYSHRFEPRTSTEKPEESMDGLTNCIVVGVSMQYDLVATYPSALAGVAPGYGYSRDAFLLQTFAQYIRYLGYRATASLNDTALGIPYAIQAGLGEYARNGLVITKEFGPRVRFGMIFTDLPLAHDLPKRFGVTEFCQICSKCAEACPAKAISFDAPNDKLYNQSNIKGVKKWSVDGEKCFNIWANQGTECGICIRVCPYNKDDKTYTDRLFLRFFLWLSASPARKLALWLDNFLGFGKRQSPSAWWKA